MADISITKRLASFIIFQQPHSRKTTHITMAKKKAAKKPTKKSDKKKDDFEIKGKINLKTLPKEFQNLKGKKK
jgi:hypothetical protein